ncbi:MAG: insulinase family protein [Bacteroidia bacterium]|nr:insulinase family protein [Bacteroidia bacterium]
MRSLLHLLFLLFMLCRPSSVWAQPAVNHNYPYDTVPGDPLKARIYTLENGLKVYLSVYKDEPRFQSMIGVKAGSKHDPADHTGLAHYLEHMLFKGTDVYGTNNYEKEAPLLDTIINLYERYGATSDSTRRAMIYRQIDSVSGVASHYAIPNEFDKMMAGIGVTGVNAYTSNEQTVYINNVPSNQLENFLTVEAERFRKPVFRLFHTELEAVYEEKNRALDSDSRKVWENLYAGLFENHPYGTQTTIGTVEHLKNPSLKAIKNYFDTYYVPNNMVIALSGDFDPDQAIRIIDEKFGKIPAKEVPPFKVAGEKFIKVPVVKEVYGPDAESVMIGFRFRGASSEDADVLTVVDYILSNGQAGLLDINLNKKQKVLSASSSTNIMKDYSVHLLNARPREGQSLEQVRDLLLAQLMEIKFGNFPDWIIPAIVTNLRLEQEREYESNMQRASAMLGSEMDGVAYRDLVNRIDRLSRINKQQVIDFVRAWYGENYVIVYKRTGVDENVVKVVKPAITPVATNSEMQTEFVKNVLSFKTPDVKPVFIDFKQEIQVVKLKNGIPLFMVRNRENNLFSLSYTLEMGFAQDKRWPVVMQYLNYMGTAKFNASQLQEEFYKLGCSFSAGAGEDEMSITLSGIQENFIPALLLLESLLSAPVADEQALSNLVDDILKRRENARLNKGEILSRVTSYARYGADNPQTYLLSREELKQLKGADLAVLLRNLTGYSHRIDYYGPADSASVQNVLAKYHKTPRGLQSIPQGKKFVEENTDDGRVFFVNYEMKQAEVNFISKGGPYSRDLQPSVQLYSRYFGGGMSSPVFQTLRESKALAYAVSSRYAAPSRPDRSYYNSAYIGTQADKLPEAMAGMMELLQEMPVSEKTFENAKDGALQGIASDRLTKTEILQSFHALRKMGISEDFREELFWKISALKLKDVEAFHARYLKGKKYRIALIGNKEKVDLKVLEKYGPLTELELNNVFGY